LIKFARSQLGAHLHKGTGWTFMALKTVYCKVRNRIRIRMIDDERIAALIRKTLRSKPEGRTNWSCRAIAAETGLSKSTVQRVWRAFGIQPHRRKHFKLSTDPLSIEKVRDIVGLT
jgi:hypothetical protein